MSFTRSLRTTLAALAATALLAGCSASGHSNTAAAPAAPQAGQADSAQGGKAAAAPAGQPGTDSQTQPLADVDPVPRSIVYTGSITVRVKDVNAAADRAESIVTTASGHLGADKRTLDDQRSEAELTLRVPAGAFAGVLADLARLGTELSRATQADDQSQAVVDISARIGAQQASVDRVRTLLAKANTIGEVVSVESELTKREAELASLQARQRVLADQVALSTITLTLLGPEVSEPVVKPAGTGFVAGLKSGWHAFTRSVQVLLQVIGALLPWAVAIGVPVWLVLFVLRRRRQPGLPAPAGPEHMSPPAG